MAFLTKTYVAELRKMKLVERTDFTRLSILSKKTGLKNGNGYTRPTFSNIINKPGRYATTDDTIALIKTFYADKAKGIKNLHDSLKIMKENLSTAGI